jgi:hypothetical protein
MYQKLAVAFHNGWLSLKTGDKLVMVLVENTNEIQGIKFYAYCCSNKNAKINLIKPK